MYTWFGLDPLTAIGLLILVALLAYAIFGGADFGGGIWDLLAPKARQKEHRIAIAKAMGPVWEANHVWLIFVLVILFTIFPSAFRSLSIAFFGLFHLLLVGIVLRGATFVFRSNADLATNTWRIWTPVFGGASAITPYILGVTVAAVASGGIRVSPEGAVSVNAALTFFSPAAIVTGLLFVAICAYLAAVYLTLETTDQLQEDFRIRGLWSGAVVAVLAAVLLPLLPRYMPYLWTVLTRPTSLVLMVSGGLLALLSGWAIYQRHYKLARVAAVGEVVAIITGWGIGQWPYLIYPDVTVANSAAAMPAIRFLLSTLPYGLALVLPSLALLFWVFKGEHPKPGSEQP